MNRNEFLKLSSGIIGGLSIPGVLGVPANAAENKTTNVNALDDSYLVKGLTGMARTEGWFSKEGRMRRSNCADIVSKLGRSKLHCLLTRQSKIASPNYALRTTTAQYWLPIA